MGALKETAMKALQITGVNNLCKLLNRNRPRIIMFHKIYPDDEADSYSEYVQLSLLDDIIAYSVKNYQIYTLKDLVQYYKQYGRYPQNAIVLTFDDGFKSILEYVLPILQKYQAPATVFVCPQLIDDETTIWPELLFDAYEHQALGGLGLQDVQVLLSRLKTLDNQHRGHELAQCIHTDYQYQHAQAQANRKLLSWDNLQTLQASGLVEIGSHSMTHPIFSNESEASVIHEINASKNKIEEKLGQKVVSFCYPNGQEDDYKQTDIDALKVSGYECAVTSVFGLPQHKDSCYLLPRFGGDFDSFLQARKYIDGVEFVQRQFFSGTE